MAAVMTAVVFDGLVSPGLARQIVDSNGPVAQSWKVAFNYNAMVDQAFMSVFVVASSIAIGLWSWPLLSRPKLNRTIGIFGLLLGSAALVGLFSGFMIRYEHLFVMAIFGQTLWFLAVGRMLYLSKSS
jgi:hypothetical protein